MERNKLYERKDDQSMGKVLMLVMGGDEDIEIAVVDFGASPMEKITATFCAVAFGGGRSPNTREALKNLAEAIEKDNQEYPIKENYLGKRR